MTASQLQEVKEKLSDPWWRLTNLYYIKDKHGKKIKFNPNWAQKFLYNNMWFMCVILKARQLGMTTFIQIFMLDRCLFNSNVAAGVIAHNREDAEDFFDKKIKFAYDQLPEAIRNERKATSDSAKMLAFSNGSSIRVGTSLRSGTYQYLHISEFGKICALRPDRAEEIIAGSINTVETGNFIFIESTADGAYGRFYDICMDAIHTVEHTKLDWKFFFFSWFDHPEYELDEEVDVPQSDADYFNRLEVSEGVTLSDNQKAWYVVKKKTQKSKMTQEYPSTPEEAFEAISEHAIYGKEFGKIREDSRIKSLPVDPAKPVHLFFDIGRSKTDATCIWFMQDFGNDFRFIDYKQGIQKPVGHYVTKIRERGYNIGKWYLPHDGDHNDYTLNTYKDRLVESGVAVGDIIIVPRTPAINIGIDQTRQKLPFCSFDKERCKEGLTALERYSWKYDEKKGVYTEPVHNWASHPSDAFRQFGQGYAPIQEMAPLPAGRKRHRA